MNNHLQSPLQVINAKSKETWSGCIEVTEPKDASVCWHIYLLQGKIQYISTNVEQQTRLNYLWQKLKLGFSFPDLSRQKVSEYSLLCQHLLDQKLSEVDIKKLLFMLVKEGLINILSIEKTSIELKPAKRINKSIVSFELKKLYFHEQVKEQIQAWQQVRKYFYSPISRLYLDQKNALRFYKIWKVLFTKPEFEILANSQKLSSFVSLFVAKSNLYEIATKAKIDIYFLARNLEESIEENIIDLLPFDEVAANEMQKQTASQQDSINQSSPADSNAAQTLIVCIDDSKTVQRQVKMTLEAANYRVISIHDPTTALKELSPHQPAVIFMDINMPNMNGYDLCSLLRKSQKFKEIPIVMLTGRDGMIDRVRAKLAGATDYLTKPCDPNKLIQLAKALEKSVVPAVQ